MEHVSINHGACVDRPIAIKTRSSTQDMLERQTHTPHPRQAHTLAHGATAQRELGPNATL